jgi:hypothetical protein
MQLLLFVWHLVQSHRQTYLVIASIMVCYTIIPAPRTGFNAFDLDTEIPISETLSTFQMLHSLSRVKGA